jgi:hypothetical protein
MAIISHIWGKVGKLFGGLLLAGGGTVSLGILLGVLLGHPVGVLLTVLLTLLVIFGLVPIALGGVMIYSSFKADAHALRDRFFSQLQANQGKLSVLGFASATRMEPAIARRHLDVWAREFHANFEVTDEGDIFYVFPIPALPPSDRQPLRLPLQIIKQAVRDVVRSL